MKRSSLFRVFCYIVSPLTPRMVRLKIHLHWVKVKAKAKVNSFFDVCHSFFDLFALKVNLYWAKSERESELYSLIFIAFALAPIQMNLYEHWAFCNFVEAHLHWTKANFFFVLCRCSMWTINLILLRTYLGSEILSLILVAAPCKH